MLKPWRKLEDKINENWTFLPWVAINTSSEIKHSIEELISSWKEILSKDNFFIWSNNFKLFFTNWSLYIDFILPRTPFMLRFIAENKELYEKIKNKIVDYSKDKSLKDEVELLLYEAYLIIRQYPESPSNYDICK